MMELVVCSITRPLGKEIGKHVHIDATIISQ